MAAPKEIYSKLSDSNLEIYVRYGEKTLNSALVKTFILYPSSTTLDACWAMRLYFWFY
jgi:hypothetical protein